MPSSTLAWTERRAGRSRKLHGLGWICRTGLAYCMSIKPRGPRSFLNSGDNELRNSYIIRLQPWKLSRRISLLESSHCHNASPHPHPFPPLHFLRNRFSCSEPVSANPSHKQPADSRTSSAPTSSAPSSGSSRPHSSGHPRSSMSLPDRRRTRVSEWRD